MAFIKDKVINVQSLKGLE